MGAINRTAEREMETTTSLAEPEAKLSDMPGARLPDMPKDGGLRPS